jgi:hypothetical protein
MNAAVRPSARRIGAMERSSRMLRDIGRSGPPPITESRDADRSGELSARGVPGVVVHREERIDQ